MEVTNHKTNLVNPLLHQCPDHISQRYQFHRKIIPLQKENTFDILKIKLKNMKSNLRKRNNEKPIISSTSNNSENDHYHKINEELLKFRKKIEIKFENSKENKLYKFPRNQKANDKQMKLINKSYLI